MTAMDAHGWLHTHLFRDASPGAPLTLATARGTGLAVRAMPASALLLRIGHMPLALKDVDIILLPASRQIIPGRPIIGISRSGI